MECLVTKLKGVVNDSNLLQIGEIRFYIKTNSTPVKFNILGENIVFKSLDGSSIFSTTSDEQNKTNTINIVNDTIFYVCSNVEAVISIDNKYNIQKFDVFSNTKNSYLSIDFSSFKYCKDLNTFRIRNINSSDLYSDNRDIAALNCKNITDIQIKSFNQYGDIACLKNASNLIHLELSACLNITGKLSSLSKLKNLTFIDVSSTAISGTLNDLINLVNLTSFSVSNNGNISGDLSQLQNLTHLTSFNAFNGGTFTGDFFSLLASRDWYNFQCNGNFNYTTKNFSGRTIRKVGSSKCVCDNLDGFLNDFKNVNSTTNGEIIMTGTRTSASDAAIFTLQGKGFTVTVPAATDTASISLMSANDFSETYRIAYKDKELIVEPTTLQIYPASGVTVKEFASEQEAKNYISMNNITNERYSRIIR